MKRTQGFTLLELMIASTIGLLLLGIAVPTANSGLDAARAAEARASLLTSLMTAANRAALTGSHGVLCPSLDGKHCRDEADWSQGWLVFLDRNNSRELDAGENIVAQQSALAAKVRLASTTGRTRIIFQGNGGNAGSNVTFTLCDGRGPAKARSLIMSNQGNLRDVPATPERAASTCAP